ncbi:MAG: hypothetical protein NTV01_18970 [Bacteroidia bacterium]|nr:hypothetical protein [Bacteroidia bacterium]
MMDEEKYIWENSRFRKDPYTMPDGYLAGFPDRMMERLMQPVNFKTPEHRRAIRPWMAWVSGIAAVLVVGWFGARTYYWKPLQEVRFQENIELFVDFYGGELHEGELAGYMEENKIDLKGQSTSEVNELIQIDPNLAEEYIYESVGF